MRTYTTTISNHGGFNTNSNYHNMKINYEEETDIMLQDLIKKYLETKMVAIKDELIKILEDESI
jgi:hypothetical protein